MSKRGRGTPPRRGGTPARRAGERPDRPPAVQAAGVPAEAAPPAERRSRPAETPASGGPRVIYGSQAAQEQAERRRPITSDDVRRYRLSVAAAIGFGVVLFGLAIWTLVTAALAASDPAAASDQSPLISSIIAGITGFFGAFAIGQGIQMLRAGPRSRASGRRRR